MKYKISELAKVLGITGTTLRRYEKNGYLIPERDKSDYRWYNEHDISRIASIRLFRKCGFSHNNIEDMLNNDSDNIKEIYSDRLNEIDAEINRLKYLRHWLKDNIKLMNTIKDLDDNFITMVSREYKIVIYSVDDKLLTEKERLETIRNFMYDVQEVQLVHVFRKDDIENNIIRPYKGWFMKTSDIERLGLRDIISDDNPFIETSPPQNYLYSSFRYPVSELNDKEKLETYMMEFKNRAFNYMENNNMILNGNILAIIVNIIGKTTDVLVCIPIIEKDACC